MRKKLWIAGGILAAIVAAAALISYLGGTVRRDLNYVIGHAPHMEGTVVEMTAEELTVESGDGLYRVTRNTEYADGRPNCKVGDRVIVYYAGDIQESWPMRFSRVLAVFGGSPDQAE